MSLDDKHDLLRLASQSFVVLSEVGSKDPDQVLTAEQWTREVAQDLAAGARWVITEGRESGTVGIYREDGSIRAEVVTAAVRRRRGRQDPVRGTPQGPAGVVDPRLRRRRQPREHPGRGSGGARDAAPGAARRHLRPHPAMAARVTEPAGTTRRNVVPGAYRGVAVSSVECDLDEESLSGISSAARPIAEPGSSSSATARRRLSSPCRRRPKTRCSPPITGAAAAGRGRRLRLPRGSTRWTRRYRPHWRRRPRAARRTNAEWWCRADTDT